MEHGRAPGEGVRVVSCLCGKEGQIDLRWDSYYCPISGVWLEPACGEKDCTLCPGRPEKHEVSR